MPDAGEQGGIELATGIVNIEGIYEPFTAPGRNPYIEESSPLYHDPSTPAPSAPATAAPGTGAPGSASGADVTRVASVPEKTAVNGPRLDDPSGWGIRVRIGRLSDGSIGLERFTSGGLRQTITWS